MKNERRFYSGILIHCYQNTVNGSLLFYSISDHLVYFTNLCVYAQRYGIIVVAACQMPDHSHLGVTAPSLNNLSCFIRDLTAAFAKHDAVVCKRHGRLFNKSFGSAPKQGAKKARSTIIYIGNNPVERQLCCKAVQYRWNYLAYGLSDHPFSDPLIIRRSSWNMKKALAEVKAQYKRKMPLTYPFLQRLFAMLDQKERNQLVDYIVTTYNVIDYQYAGRFFDSIGDMVKAMDYNTGSEHDLNETKQGRSDACYAQITKWLMKEKHLKDIHEIFLLSEEQRAEVLFEIYCELKIEVWQIAKYLRIKVRNE